MFHGYVELPEGKSLVNYVICHSNTIVTVNVNKNMRLTGWWFGTFFNFPYIGNIHPKWLSYFSEEWLNHQPENMRLMYNCFVHVDFDICSENHNGPPNLSEHPTVDPEGATNPWKQHSFCVFVTFCAPASSFFWLFILSDLLFFSLLFLSLILLNSTVHIVSRLTFDFPLVIVRWSCFM